MAADREALLDLVPELGDRLDAAERDDARSRLKVPVVDIDEGVIDLDRLRRSDAVTGEVLGLWVASGSVMIDVHLGGRTCSHSIGRGDLILMDSLAEGSVPMERKLWARSPSRLAILDDRLLGGVQRWPRLLSTIFVRAAQQAEQALAQQAISQLPNVTDRLLAHLWLTADRCGHVRSDGVHVPLSVTHETLGHMIGAQRSTVTLGLRKLSEEGLVEACDDGWLLTPGSREQLPGPVPEDA